LEWFAVEATWMDTWKSYLKDGKRVKPAEISNWKLFMKKDKHLYELKPNLTKEYKIVASPVFKMLYTLYGGGPIIPCNSKTIYSTVGLK
jgi:hypothetical protein